MDSWEHPGIPWKTADVFNESWGPWGPMVPLAPLLYSYPIPKGALAKQNFVRRRTKIFIHEWC